MVTHSVFVTHPIGALSLNDSAKKVQTSAESSLLELCRVQPFFERQCKDTAFFWNHQILGGDKGRFSAAFKLKLR